MGLCSAYWLHRSGHQVELLEREAGPGLGTSFANGALLHPSLAGPWNTPGVGRELLRHLGRADAPMRLRPHALPRLIPWGLRFLRESAPARYAHNLERNLALARASQGARRAMLLDTALIDHARPGGSLSVFRDKPALHAAAAEAARHGIDHRPLTPAQVVALEPALAGAAQALAGGLHFVEDEAADAHAFCCALSAWLQGQGVVMRWGAPVAGVALDTGRRRFVALRLASGENLPSDALVVAAGVHAPALLRPLGIALPVQPVKGYSITCPIPPEMPHDTVPRWPVVDHGLHAALVPLGPAAAGVTQALRVAGTAEFTGDDRSVQPERIENLLRLLDAVYPALGAQARREPAAVKHWAGLRPMTPDGVPRIGATRIDGVFVNAGHGHLGWTLAAGSGQLLAAVMSGLRSPLNAADYALR